MVVRQRAMSPHGKRIWVVITDGASTRICSCQDGMTTPITAPLLHLNGSALVEADVRAYKAWFKAERQDRLTRNPRRQHAWHISQLLLEGGRDGAYDGLIVIAAPPVVAELKDALAPETRALLIGKIICDDAIVEPAAACDPAEIRH